MANIKWSAFPSTASAAASGDTLVGLHSGANYQFGITATPTALAIAQWDTNKNLSANNALLGYATTATAAGTTSLLVSSKYQQFFTGTMTQTVVLPDVATLVLGQGYYIVNNSTGVVTVESHDTTTIQAMDAGTILNVTCISLTDNSAAGWDVNYKNDTEGVVSLTGTTNRVTVSPGVVVGNYVLSAPQDIATTSSPTFAALTLTAPLTGANGGTGKVNTGKTIDLGGGSTGYVLTRDSSGNAAWQVSAGSGTVNPGTAQQVAYYATTSSAVSGLTVSNNSALIANNSGNLASLGFSTTATASNLVERDSNINIFANNSILNETSNGGGNLYTLTAASSRRQIVTTGSGATIIVLPDATTLKVGWTFEIINNSNATVTVDANDGATQIVQIQTNQSLFIYVTNIGTTNGTWDYKWFIPTSMSNGQILIGGGSSGPLNSTLSAGTNISITNGTNSISIASTGGTVSPGTAQQVAYYATSSSTISGLTVSNNSALTANGSGNLASLGYSTTATASNLVERDSNANTFANNDILNQTSNAAGGTVTLTAASSKAQLISGAGATTLVLPDATTLKTGWTYYVNNNTASTVTVKYNDTTTTLTSILAGMYVQIYNTGIGSTNGTWDYHWLIPSNMADGQIVIGATTSGPKAANITAGTGISITNAANSITIASSGGGLSWSGISGTTQAAAVNNGYIVQNASQTTITLPLTAAIGNVVSIRGLGAGGWILAANTGQTIKIGSSTTSSAGSLTSAEQYDTVDVTCIVANTTWSVNSVVSSGLTIS